MPYNSEMRQGFERIFLFLVLALCTLTLCASYLSFWTDSEMLSSVQVQYFLTGSPHFEFSLKPLFNLFLYLNYQISKSLDVHPMWLARGAMVLGAVATFALTYKILKMQLMGRTSLVVLLLLISNSFVIKRAAHVRSDLLSGAVLLFALWLYLRAAKWRGPMAILPLMLVASLITPKLLPACAVLFLLMFGARVRAKGRGTVAFLVGGLAALVLVGLLQPGAYEFFINSLVGGSSSISIWDWQRFEHVGRYFKENPVFLFLIPGVLVLATVFRKSLSGHQRLLVDFANFNSLLVLLYPDRLPFFIAATTPFWILPVPALAERLSKKQTWGLVIVIWGVFSSVFWSGTILKSHGSFEQQKYISWINLQTLPPFGKVYDLVGLRPFDKSAERWFVGPAEAANAYLPQFLEWNSVGVLFYVNRLIFAEPGLSEYLAQNYWHDGAGIFIRKLSALNPNQSLLSKELAKQIEKRFPGVDSFPSYPLKVFMYSHGVDLTRYAKWPNGANVGEYITLEQLNEFKFLDLPKGTTELIVLPAFFRTPFDQNSRSLFRFDPEF